jgi:hypothetical protein
VKYFFCLFLTALSLQAEVKPMMQEFFKLTETLQPFIIDKRTFMDEKNEAEIKKALTEFSAKTKKLKKDKMTQNDDMKFRVKLLTEGLDEAESSFKTGFKDYSYWVLKASLNNCYSCHTQKGLPTTAFKLKANGGSNDTYAQAEFLFIVRNYRDSLPLFEKLLINYPANEATTENIEAAAQKILFYSMRVSRDDVASIAVFNRILKNKELPAGLRNDIIAWRKYLNIRKYRISEKQIITTENELQEFMKSRENISEEYRFSNQRAAADLDTSHFLFQLLENNKDKSMKPAIMYWLATIERDYRISMFDQTADNYLKECIEKYSTSKIAKKCFTLYKELQIISYTGSRGTDLPKSVSKQLDNYEKLVNKK